MQNNMIFVFTNQEKKENIYFNEKSKRFYRNKAELFDKMYVLLSLFLAPITVFLKSKTVENSKFSYGLACVIGIILSIIFMKLIKISKSKKKYEQVNISMLEIERGLKSLEEYKKMMLLLLIVWLVFFSIASLMVFDKQTYESILALTFTSSFLLPLLIALKFTRYKKMKRVLAELL